MSKNQHTRKSNTKLTIRQTTFKDAKQLEALSKKIYKNVDYTTEEMIRGQVTVFPEGQFVVEYNDEIVGYCSTFIIAEKIAMKAHTWDEISGAGFASRHDPNGDYLYGMDVCVDADYRGLRIGTRLYNKRRELCEEMGLKGIIFGGRMPGFSKKKKDVKTPEAYLELVKARKIRDPVVFFHLSNGFEPIGILKNYLKQDPESDGNATHMLWQNPAMAEPIVGKSKKRDPVQKAVRVATVQFQMRKVRDESEFESQLEYFIDISARYGADFVLFPELVTLALLSATDKKMRPEESINHLTHYTERYIKFMEKMAISYNINIIGGTHPTKTNDDEIQNICYVFLRNGDVYAQEKIHPTPTERFWWNIKGGDSLDAIPTDCGPIGILICYDTEFPETARHLVDQGALIIFVPFCTDERQGYLRVRYCCQAIAVQNQCYVAMSGTVGNLPDVENRNINYAESCILTPCDFPFARDGIAATTPTNTETIAFADLNMEDLIASRYDGTVQNLRDRRFDLYSIKWKA